MPPDLDAFVGDPDFMMSLARGLAVMQLVAAAGRPITLAEVSRRSNLSRGAARRCLYTLCQLGYVTNGELGYSPRNAMLSLGRGFVATHSLAAKAQPLLDALRDELGESCSIGVLDDDFVRYVGRAEATRIMSINLRIGSRLPLYATSMGRVLLAGCTHEQRAGYLARIEPAALTARTITDKDRLAAIIEQTARSGFTIVDQELESGLRSASVPVFGRGGVIAALNVGTPAARVTIDALRTEIIPSLRRCAAAISGQQI